MRMRKGAEIASILSKALASGFLFVVILVEAQMLYRSGNKQSSQLLEIV